MKRTILQIGAAAVAISAVLFVVGKAGTDRHVSAAGQTPAYTCPNGQVFTSHLVNTGGSCSSTLTISGTETSYTSAGLATAGLRHWYGSVTSTTAGLYTVDWSAAGFTAAPIFVNVMAASTGVTGATTFNATIQKSTITTTGASGAVMVPATIVVGGSPIALATTSTTVYIEAVGW